MTKDKKNINKKGVSSRKRAPVARNPENRLQQLSSLAVDVLEERLRTGRATGSEIIFAAQFADPNRVIKTQKLHSENELLKSKKQVIESTQHTEELYAEAIKAMLHYQGKDTNQDADL